MAQLDEVFKPRHSYKAKHAPSGETWLVIAVNRKKGKCFAAGWPHTIAQISDMVDWEVQGPLEPDEIEHNEKRFPHEVD